jgi:hypothetical protein
VRDDVRRWRIANVVLGVGTIVAAFGFRALATEVALQQGRSFLPDSELYWGYAESLAVHGTFQAGGAGARRTPGYPLFIAACTRLFGQGDPVVPPTKGQLRAVLYAQALLGGLVAGMTWFIANQLFEDDSKLAIGATFASTAAMLDPFATAISAMVLSETLFTAALVATIWCGMNLGALSRSERRLSFAVFAGLMAGAAVLVRPSGLLLAPIGLAFVVRRWGMAKSLAATTAFIVVLSPWIVRNYAVYGRFVPTTLNVGESLYDGWNPNADGGSDMKFVDERKRMHGTEASPADEIAEDAFWKSSALAWAKENPGRVVELAAVKLWRYWSPWPNAAEFQSPIVVVGCTVFSVLVYAGALLGVVVCWRTGRWNLLALGLVPALYFAVLHAVFVSSVRYRAPAMPMLEVLAGFGFAWWVSREAKPSAPLTRRD